MRHRTKQRRFVTARSGDGWTANVGEEAPPTPPKNRRTQLREAKRAARDRSDSPQPQRLDPSRTVGLRRALAADLTAKFAAVKGKIWKFLVTEDALGLASAQAVANLSVLDVRQEEDWDCGAAAVETVVRPLGVTLSKDRLAELLRSNPRTGTSPEDVIRVMRGLGLDAWEFRDDESLTTLRGATDKGQAVLCPIQRGGNSHTRGQAREGHWVVATAVTDRPFEGQLREITQVDFQDPAQGPRVLGRREWLDLWHDRLQDGTRHVRYGIAIGKEGTFNESYFATCEREHGRCLPKGEGGEQEESDQSSVDVVLGDMPRSRGYLAVAARALRVAKDAAMTKLHTLSHLIMRLDVIPIASDVAREALLKGAGASNPLQGVPLQDIATIGTKALAWAWGKVKAKLAGKRTTVNVSLEGDELEQAIDAVLEVAKLLGEMMGRDELEMPSREEIADRLRKREKQATENRDSSQAEIEEQAALADPDPTSAQREAGNYVKGHVTVQGLPITIETAAGNKRKPWHEKLLSCHYGYVKARDGIQRSEADGDHVDVFLGPYLDSTLVHVIDQYKEDDSFDEHKALLGFWDEGSAREAYLTNYPDGWKSWDGPTQLTMDEFKEWLREGDTSKPLAGRSPERKEVENSNPEGHNQYTGRTVKEGMDLTKSAAIAARHGEHGKDWEDVAQHFPGVAKPVFHNTRAAIQAMDEGLQSGKGSVFGGAAGGNMNSVSMSSNLDWATRGQGRAFGANILVMDEDSLAKHGDVRDYQAPDIDDYEFERRFEGSKIPPSEIKGMVIPKHLSPSMRGEPAEWPFPVVYLDKDKGWTKIPQKVANLSSPLPTFSQETLASNVFQARTDPERVKAFQSWLREQFGDLEDEELWRRYAEAGFKKGASRSHDDVRKVAQGQQRLDFYAGTKDEFLRGQLGAPTTVDKIKLLAGRAFDDLKNVTHDMSTRISRTLADGLTKGQGPRQIAVQMAKDVDMSKERALIIARSEIVRAHAEGQLHALEALGVESLGVDVEWSDTSDGKVCEKCAALDGMIFSVADAHGLIPAHPNCRCAFRPKIKGPSLKQMKAAKQAKATANARKGATEQPRDDHGRFTSSGVTSGHWSELPKSVQTQLDNLEPQLISLRLERGLFLSKKGKILVDRTGKHQVVRFNEEESWAPEAVGGVFTHGHGNTESNLSKDDIVSAAAFKLAQIRAVTPTYTYIAGPKAGQGWPSENKIKKAFSDRSRWEDEVALGQRDENGIPIGFSLSNSRERIHQWAEYALNKLGLEYHRVLHSSRGHTLNVQLRDDHGRFAAGGALHHLSKLKAAFPSASDESLQAKHDRLARGELSVGFDWRVGKSPEIPSATTQTAPKTASGSPPKPDPQPVSKDQVEAEVRRLSAVSRFGLVKLHDLHDALGRPELGSFHAAVQGLRRDGVLEGQEHEGREGMSDRERETAIVDPSSRTHGLGSRITSVAVRNEKGSFFATCERDEKGHCVSEGTPERTSAAEAGKGSGKGLLDEVIDKTGSGQSLLEEILSTPKSKHAGKTVDGAVQKRAEDVKHEVAKLLGGAPEEFAIPSKGEAEGQKDKKPYDVKIYGKRGGKDQDVEVKSLLVGSKQSLSVHEDALLRKVEHVERTGNGFHTVAVDDREGGDAAEHYSGHRLYYKRGSGRYSLSQMHPVKNAAELKRLIAMPDDALPEKARGSLPPPPPVAKLREGAAKVAEGRARRDKARKEKNKDKLREQARARAAAKREGRVGD